MKKIMVLVVIAVVLAGVLTSTILNSPARKMERSKGECVTLKNINGTIYMIDSNNDMFQTDPICASENEIKVSCHLSNDEMKKIITLRRINFEVMEVVKVQIVEPENISTPEAKANVMKHIGTAHYLDNESYLLHKGDPVYVR